MAMFNSYVNLPEGNRLSHLLHYVTLLAVVNYPWFIRDVHKKLSIRGMKHQV